MADVSLLDEALNYLGRYGRYQVTCAVVVMTVGNWLPAWHLMGVIFTADRPAEYRCAAEPDALGLVGNGSVGLVETAGPRPRYYEKATGNSRNLTGDDECTDGTGEACTEWQYHTHYGETTLVTDLDLVCDRSLLAETAQSIYLVGMLVGSLLFGFVSDAFGRKPVLLSACLAHGVCGVAAAFVWSYPSFVALWFFIGMFAQAYNQVQFVIVMELFPPECRTLMGSLNNMFWGLGVVTLTPIAYLLKDWRHMQLAISVPCLLSVPLWFVLDDSVRWLLAKGRYEEARRILHKMARWNRRAPPTGGFAITRGDEHASVLGEGRDGESLAEAKKSCTFLDVLKSRRLLLNTVVIYFCWFVSMMAYYGASLNSSHLVGNKYANYFFLGLAEIPAFFIIHFAMTWFGRRPSLALFFLASGLASVITAFVPKQTDAGTDLTALILVMAILAKLFITCAFSINLIYCSEIFPTPVRSVGFGIGAVIANIGTVIAPFVIYLGDLVTFLPLTIFGGLSLIACGLVPVLPETKDKALPETIDDAEHLGRRRPPRKPTKRRGVGRTDGQRPAGGVRPSDFEEDEDAL